MIKPLYFLSLKPRMVTKQILAHRLANHAMAKVKNILRANQIHPM